VQIGRHPLLGARRPGAAAPDADLSSGSGSGGANPSVVAAVTPRAVIVEARWRAGWAWVPPRGCMSPRHIELLAAMCLVVHCWL
jgi:hypothetical protein